MGAAATAAAVHFGFIGAGEIARYMAGCLRQAQEREREGCGVRVVAVADPNTAAARGLADACGAGRVYADHRELLSSDEVEAVYVATPPYLHKRQVLDAIAAGKHVLSEKPFMMNAAEVGEVAAALARRPGLKVGSCSCRFHSPLAARTRQLLADGALGAVRRVRFIAARPGVPGRHSWTGWKADVTRSGGGALMDWGCYDLDYLDYVLGAAFDPTAVWGWTDRPREAMETTYAAEIACGSGVRVTWERNLSEAGGAKSVVEFRGDRGGLDVAMAPSEATPVLWQVDGDGVVRQELAERTGTWQEASERALGDLARAIRDGGEPATPVARSLKIARLVEAVYASARAGRVVEVEA